MIDLLAIILQGAGCLGALIAVFFLIGLIGSELAERSVPGMGAPVSDTRKPRARSPSAMEI